MGNYSELLKDPRWQRKRLEIFKRDNFTCRECLDSDKTLHVHHILYESKFPWETSDRFLVTLCEKCHDEEEALKDFNFYQITQLAALTRMNTYRILNATNTYFSFVECADAYSVADFLMAIKAKEDSLRLLREVAGNG